MRWSVKGYAVRGGLTVIDEWLERVPAEAAAKFDVRLAFLADRMMQDWPHNYAHPRKGSDGIFEIKFDSGNIAYRPLCCLGPGKGVITVLIFAIEHNNKDKPPSAQKTATKRMNEIKSNPKMAINYDY